MRKKRNLKEADASVRFTCHGKILSLIAAAAFVLILLAGAAYGVSCLSEKRSDQAETDKKTEENALKTEKSRMPEISNIERSSKQMNTSESGRWIYRGSYTGTSLKEEDIRYLENSVKKWTHGELSDEELTEWITQRITNLKLPLQAAGVMSHRRCLFESEDAIPDYEANLRANGGIYTFIGLYTEDKVDEEGNLICYYWEAGVR